MESFDVESLFTNVPIDDVVQATLQKLENDPSLPDRTTLTPAQIADLLNFVSRSTYFQCNGSIYEQKEGTAMESPVSAVIANLYYWQKVTELHQYIFTEDSEYPFTEDNFKWRTMETGTTKPSRRKHYFNTRQRMWIERTFWKPENNIILQT